MLPLKPSLACCFLISAILLRPAGCLAELVIGTVVRVDRAGEILTLRPMDGGNTTSLRVRIRSPLPVCVRPGNIIRVWGAFGPDGQLFTATDIRGAGRGAGNDPTGVRFRLQRSIGRRQHPAGRPMHRGSGGRMR